MRGWGFSVEVTTKGASWLGEIGGGLMCRLHPLLCGDEGSESYVDSEVLMEAYKEQDRLERIAGTSNPTISFRNPPCAVIRGQMKLSFRFAPNSLLLIWCNSVSGEDSPELLKTRLEEIMNLRKMHYT
ncbi:hypothetical protein E2562_024479 [Oryza meyeriana var. granulata]|uniref:Uncharacterized protein n=1 Tax=Oryza meyeriana var. granulata TaxID=110450 RepID=A0A6G1FBQ5_9ORYZ|nr:hypothetical protein E2562_024479 [Oryza meyeriana var. granulata]